MDFMMLDVFSIFLLNLYAICISFGFYLILRRILKSFFKAENLPGPGKYSPSGYYVILDSNTSPSSPPLEGQIFNPTLPLPLGDLSCNLKNSYLEKSSGPGETTEPLLDRHPGGPLSCSSYQEGSSSPVHHHRESIFRFDLGPPPPPCRSHEGSSSPVHHHRESIFRFDLGPPPPCRSHEEYTPDHSLETNLTSDPVKPSSSESVPSNQTVNNEWCENGFPSPAPASSNRLPVRLGEWSGHGYGHGWPPESGKDARPDYILQQALQHSQENILTLNPLKDAPPGSSNPADHSLQSNLASDPLKDAPADNLHRQNLELLRRLQQQVKLSKERLRRLQQQALHHSQESILRLNPLKDAPPGSSNPADHSQESNLASDAPVDNLQRQRREQQQKLTKELLRASAVIDAVWY